MGGLQLALDEVADQLRAHGWQVDVHTHAAPDAAGSLDGPLRTTVMRSRLEVFHRWPVWMRLRHTLSAQTRQRIAMFFMPPAFLENASNNLYRVEELLAAQPAYDVVLLCVDGAAPGMARLVTERHDCCVVLSLWGVATELGAFGWPWLRWLARARLGGHAHPYLFRRVSPRQIRRAIFASRDWQNDAIRAGLPAETARTIYFGVPFPPPLPRPERASGRLLWVGRLSPEKGLHILLQALPGIRERCKDVSLTVIAGQGPAAYRMGILNLIERLGLRDVVAIRSSVLRSALPAVYAGHDALFFYSMLTDPVALVLMEAFNACLPVVASRASPKARLVQDGVTCVSYRPEDTGSVVEAVVGLLTNADLGRRLAASAHERVRREFSLDSMGQAYDGVLREFVSDLTTP